MHAAGQQLVEATVEEAVVRDLGARRSLTGVSRSVGFELGGDAAFRELQAQATCVDIEQGGAAGADTVLVDLDYQSPNVEAIIEPVAVSGKEPGQRPVRSRRSRKNAVADLDDAPEEAARQRTLAFQRELADILACIFAEAQAAGRLDALVGQRVETLGGERD